MYEIESIFFNHAVCLCMCVCVCVCVYIYIYIHIHLTEVEGTSRRLA